MTSTGSTLTICTLTTTFQIRDRPRPASSQDAMIALTVVIGTADQAIGLWGRSARVGHTQITFTNTIFCTWRFHGLCGTLSLDSISRRDNNVGWHRVPNVPHTPIGTFDSSFRTHPTTPGDGHGNYQTHTVEIRIVGE
eukprot:scaffold1513_cov100-Amphora_coffeaeformis.AAC.17